MPEDRKGCCGSYCDSFSEYVALLQQPTRSLSVKQYVALDFSKDAGKTPPDEAALLAAYETGVSTVFWLQSGYQVLVGLVVLLLFHQAVMVSSVVMELATTIAFMFFFSHLVWYLITKENCCCMPCCVAFIPICIYLGAVFAFLAVLNVVFLIGLSTVFSSSLFLLKTVSILVDLALAVYSIPMAHALWKLYYVRRGSSSESVLPIWGASTSASTESGTTTAAAPTPKSAESISSTTAAPTSEAVTAQGGGAATSPKAGGAGRDVSQGGPVGGKKKSGDKPSYGST